MPPKIAAKRPERAVAGGGMKQSMKGKGKEKQIEKGKLKKWLKTPEDWKRFNEWAKINAQPRKIPEPEPIIRKSKPLRLMMTRIRCLAIPSKRYDPSIHCRTDYLTISERALTATPSKRILQLAVPVIREEQPGREFPMPISKAALRYEASERIIEISRPLIKLPESCKPWANSKKMSKRKMTQKRRLMILSKKMFECPELMTDEERDELMTSIGVRRTALIYEFTPWMLILSLPSYKILKDRNDKTAKEWKRLLVEETPARGKKALAEYRKTQGTASSTDEKQSAETESADDNYKNDEKEKKRIQEKNAWRYAPPTCKDDPYAIKKAALKATASTRTIELAEPVERENKSCRENPFDVKKGALTASASGRVAELSKPARPRSPVTRQPPREKNEYGQPIFKKPVYGKRLPPTKPYKMGQYKKTDEERKKKPKNRRPIDPIAFEPTVDPDIFPELAKKQKRERMRAAKMRETKKKKNQ